MTRRLAIVVTTAPARGDFLRALALALAARRGNVDVDLFFMDEAVAELPRRRRELAELADAGCELVACAHSAQLRGIGEADVGMLLGSQDDHAAIVHRADRLVAFT